MDRWRQELPKIAISPLRLEAPLIESDPLMVEVILRGFITRTFSSALPPNFQATVRGNVLLSLFCPSRRGAGTTAGWLTVH